MIRIVDKICSGKTRKLIEEAKANDYIVVCYNPQGMSTKARNYGILGVEFVSYADFIYKGVDKPYVIDNLEQFITTIYDGLQGYTLTIGD